MSAEPWKILNEHAVSQVYSNSRYCVETLKPRSNIWIWQMFVLFSSVLPLQLLSYTSLPLNLMFQPLCCETSAPHSLFLSFFTVSSFLCIHTLTQLHTLTHIDRTLFLMTDGKSTIVQHQSLKTQTHTPHAHTNKHHLLVLLSLCAQSPVRCPDLFLTVECMH